MTKNEDLDHLEEPVSFYSNHFGISIPIVPFSVEQNKILNDPLFISLLRQLGFHLHEGKLAVFPRYLHVVGGSLQSYTSLCECSAIQNNAESQLLNLNIFISFFHFVCFFFLFKGSRRCGARRNCIGWGCFWARSNRRSSLSTMLKPPKGRWTNVCSDSDGERTLIWNTCVIFLPIIPLILFAHWI